VAPALHRFPLSSQCVLIWYGVREGETPRPLDFFWPTGPGLTALDGPASGTSKNTEVYGAVD
jgi:hypothetical protein